MNTVLTLTPPAALLALGVVLLLWGADRFMDDVVAVARFVRVSVLVVGLLAAGAEPEELTTSLVAAANGRPYLAVGDVIGANVAMVALGLGVAFVVAGRALADGMRRDPRLRRYALAASVCGAAAAGALADGYVARWEGGLLTLGYVVFAVWAWRAGQTGSQPAAPRQEGPRRGRIDILAAWALGLLAMVVGGAVVVDGAAELAAASGWGERATGLIVLGLATSVEVFALVRAARSRRLTTVAVAAVLGSVAFNATLTLGLAALVAPLTVTGVTGAAALAAVLPLLVLLAYRGRLVRPLGVGLIASYLGFAVWAAGALP